MSGQTYIDSKLMCMSFAELQVPAAASGLIAGDGLWTLPECILSIVKANPPICMSFQSSAAVAAAAATSGA